MRRLREMEGMRESRRDGAAFLVRLLEIPGIYVPSFYEPVYDAGRALSGIEAAASRSASGDL
jgi:hypothetical protein